MGLTGYITTGLPSGGGVVWQTLGTRKKGGNMEPLSLAQTHELLDIVEARDWDALEELIAVH